MKNYKLTRKQKIDFCFEALDEIAEFMIFDLFLCNQFRNFIYNNFNLDRSRHLTLQQRSDLLMTNFPELYNACNIDYSGYIKNFKNNYERRDALFLALAQLSAL